MKCAEVILEFVKDNSYNEYYWKRRFIDCEDYPKPREPEVVTYDRIENIIAPQLTIPSRSLIGKKWRAVFTEIIE